MHKISNSVRLTLYFNGLTLLIFHGKKTIEPQGLSDHLPTLTIQHSVCSETLPMDFIMAFFFLASILFICYYYSYSYSYSYSYFYSISYLELPCILQTLKFTDSNILSSVLFLILHIFCTHSFNQ